MYDLHSEHNTEIRLSNTIIKKRVELEIQISGLVKEIKKLTAELNRVKSDKKKDELTTVLNIKASIVEELRTKLSTI